MHYGVRYIIVSEESEMEAPGIQQMLRKLLTGPEFRLIARVPIQSNDKAWRDSVALYENTAVQIPQDKQLKIPMYIAALRHRRTAQGLARVVKNFFLANRGSDLRQSDQFSSTDDAGANGALRRRGCGRKVAADALQIRDRPA